MSSYHPVVQQIKDLLTQSSLEYKCFEHDPVRTSEEAASLRPEYSISQGAKALILRIKKKEVPKEEQKQFVQIVVPGDAKFDPKKARHALHATDIRFALPEEVERVTDGVQPGGVPPFGNIFGLEVYVDKTLLENQEIIFNAGDRSCSIAMKSEDYLKVVKPNVVSIV
ncbi:MAG: Ala-tRNA(Pro) deacylase [Acidimicrobiales bacterium]|jgi:Ala-tRNA(Pro) deacylase